MTERVLYSFAAPAPDANPYVHLLLRSLDGQIEPLFFSWREALLGEYDVFHAHWPEALLRSGSRREAPLSVVRFVALLVRLRLRRTTVVRTLHNETPHEPGGRLERLLLAALDRLTTRLVVLTDKEPPARLATARRTHVPHGHYRDWYAAPGAAPEPGRVSFVGLVRPYKGVDDLLSALPDSQETRRLVVLGRAAPGDAQRLRALARDPRCELRLRHIDDDELVAAVEASELVVLPYRRLLNSGVLLLALSLDRPVLVPGSDAMATFADEVGAGWIHTFPLGGLTGRAIDEALRASRAASRGVPDLTGRDWDSAAAAHLEVYRAP